MALHRREEFREFRHTWFVPNFEFLALLSTISPHFPLLFKTRKSPPPPSPRGKSPPIKILKSPPFSEEQLTKNPRNKTLHILLPRTLRHSPIQNAMKYSPSRYKKNMQTDLGRKSCFCRLSGNKGDLLLRYNTASMMNKIFYAARTNGLWLRRRTVLFYPRSR